MTDFLIVIPHHKLCGAIFFYFLDNTKFNCCFHVLSLGGSVVL